MKVGATRKGASRGAAWLSSARVVRCWVKSRNERNPYPVLLPAREDSQETAADNVEEGGDDVKSSWPLCPGLHTCYNGAYRGKQDRKVEQIPKARPSSDRGLQLALVKVESLVIADQHGRGEYVPGPCTHRPSHHESPLQPKLPLVGNEIVIGDWGEVVTR
jgi:hypothetical protein